MGNTIISARNGVADIALGVEVWKEGPSYIAYTSDLDISSVGKTANQAKSRLREAVSLFIEEAAPRALWPQSWRNPALSGEARPIPRAQSSSGKK